MSFYAYVKQPDDTEIIWHYFDFARFMLMLEQRALYFKQVTQLDHGFESYGAVGDTAPGSNIHATTPDSGAFVIPPRACLVVSCWHAHEIESIAMWRHYQPAGAYLAIRSTVQNLKTSLNFAALRYVKVGTVNYQPPELRDGETGVSIEVDYFYKHESLAFEREIRILAHVRDLETSTRLGGAFVPVDLSALVQGIHIAPQAPSWYGELVRSLVVERYGLDVPIAIPEHQVRALI